jgi:hypothetical protein
VGFIVREYVSILGIVWVSQYVSILGIVWVSQYVSILGIVWLALWCLMPLSTLSYLYIVVVSFTGEGNRSTQRKPPTCRKSLTNFIT